MTKILKQKEMGAGSVEFERGYKWKEVSVRTYKAMKQYFILNLNRI